MLGSFSRRSWEISSVPDAVWSGGARKATSRKLAQLTDEKSDRPVVPKKSPNNGQRPAEVREGRGLAKRNVDRSPVPRTQSRIQGTSRGLEGVRSAARRDRRQRFTALLHHITPQLLTDSLYALKRDAAAGVDGVTWKQYEAHWPERVHALHRAIHTGAYRAHPARRVYIPKRDGRRRPLGIAALEDKVVQQAVVTVLSAIYEETFLGFSYGFRPGRSQHDALDALAAGIRRRKVNWILDADIHAFFDEVDHAWMLRFLAHRIADRRLLHLIRKWLTVGWIEDGVRVPAVRGTPQGAVISPLLANIYLHYVLDLWVHQWRQRHAVGDVIVVRYADDSVYGFQNYATAQRFRQALRERLAHFGLTLNTDKTRLLRFGRYASEQRRRQGLTGRPETFSFLGFTHCCGTTRTGGFKLTRLTDKVRMRATLAALRDRLKRRRHEPVPVLGRWLGRVLRGYFNYYAVPGNVGRLDGFRSAVGRLWRQALLRRSQRHRLSWARFAKLARLYLPYPRASLHPYPEQRFAASHT